MKSLLDVFTEEILMYLFQGRHVEKAPLILYGLCEYVPISALVPNTVGELE